ncbi:MAG: hypothetical protein GY860_17935 [Desulfobacteraceae bacterium]|nr:hypothetical protein [Desulfobacteraceae bacterium]
MTGKVSKLVKDLSTIPEIIGALGLSIAEAQKAFNLDYMENIERLIGIAKQLQSGPEIPADLNDEAQIEVIEQNFQEFKAYILDLLKTLAPPRYQYTETTLSVKLDLAQTMSTSVSGGFSIGYGGIALNAAMTMGYGYDYRAAAEVKTIIHAEPADKTTFKALLGQADKFSNKALDLPAGAQVDKDIIEKTYAIANKLIGTDFKAKTSKPA